MEPFIKGKIVIITGASDGIGEAAARELHKGGAKVVIIGRSPEKTAKVAAELGVPYYLADFSRFSDVRALAEKLKADFRCIDVLINNAGGIAGNTRIMTADGFERTLQINHLSPFLLTSLLLNTLVSSKSTVITTSSSANLLSRKLNLADFRFDSGYSAWNAYNASKLMNILFAKELANRYADKGILSASFHPGIVRTQFSREAEGPIRLVFDSFLNRFLLTPSQGADTMVWLATRNDWKNGGYFAKRKLARMNPQAKDAQLAHDLWEVSAAITGLK